MVITKLCALMITNFAKALGKGVTWVLGGGGARVWSGKNVKMLGNQKLL